MNISKISEWTRDKNNKIVFILFLIDWFISTLFWISANSNLNLFSIWYYLLLLLFWIILPYISKNLILKVRKRIMEHPKDYKWNKNVKLSTDPRNLDLSYSIAIWIIARIINFLEFNNFSLLLIFFIAINLAFGIMIGYMTALFSWKKKGTLIFLFTMVCINVIYVIIGFMQIIVIIYELTPFDPIIIFIVLLILIFVLGRLNKVHFSPFTSSTS